MRRERQPGMTLVGTCLFVALLAVGCSAQASPVATHALEPLQGSAAPRARASSAVPSPPSPVAAEERVTYTQVDEDNSSAESVWTMKPDGRDAQVIAAIDGGNASWSPDGTRLAYESYGIVVADSTGENQRLLTRSPYAHDPTWSHDGDKIAFADGDPDFSGQIYVMNADGSGLTLITEEEGSTRSTAPVWSPDGTRIAFAQSGESNSFQVFTVRAEDGSDLRRLSLDNATSYIPYDWSPDGQAVLATKRSAGDDTGPSDIVWLAAADGRETQLTDDPQDDTAPILSPDGTTVIFSSLREGAHLNLYSMAADGSGVRRLTDQPINQWATDWSLAVGEPTSDVDAEPAFGNGVTLTVADADGISDVTLPGERRDVLIQASDVGYVQTLSWDPLGRRLAFVARGEEEEDALYVLDNATGGVRKLATADYLSSIAWSADGSWISLLLGSVGELWVVRPDGQGLASVLGNGESEGSEHVWEATWTGPETLAFQWQQNSFSDTQWSEFDVSSGSVVVALAGSPPVLQMRHPSQDLELRVADDGIHVSRLDGSQDIVVTTPWRSGSYDDQPRWLPDGSGLLFLRHDPAGSKTIWLVASDGRNERQALDPDVGAFDVRPDPSNP